MIQTPGDYRFIPGGFPYSSGVRADPGHEIVHVTLLRPVPWRAGFELIESHLGQAGRERRHLCSVELRSPAPFTRQGFMDFNQGYRAVLEDWNLLVDGENPIARTNVAPSRCAPSEVSLYGFGYTVPSQEAAPTFILAGSGELRGGPMLEAAVIRPNETSPEAMREKASYVLRAMEKRLEGLEVGWEHVTCTDVYTVQPIRDVLESLLLERIGPAAIHGIRWHYSRPPIDELEFEMDARGVRRDLVIG
jgi:hypothetical protein